jgi:hypothetical protein
MSGGGGGGGGGGSGLGMINTLEACERIKEEYNFLQAQNANLKLECEKIVQEKTEMQRHYVMVILYYILNVCYLFSFFILSIMKCHMDSMLKCINKPK